MDKHVLYLELNEVANEKKHWYETLPGILTGIAAIIGAIASLYVAIDGKDESRSMEDETKFEENRTTSSVAKLSAPVMEKPECNSARKWPPDNHYFPIYWHPVEGAASFGIEIDCRSSKDDPTAWRGSENHPWFIERGVAFRMMNNPIYSSKIHLKAKEVGCNALRWRVWAIDHDGIDGEKSQWCQISFF